MANKVVVGDSFRRQAKKLSKRYKSLPADVQKVVDSLKLEARLGTPLGGNAYKIRVAIASKSKGKSGGGRIITYVYIAKEIVYLIAIYDKSEIPNISDLELSMLIKEVEDDLNDK